jgi:hypothetical protein
MTPHRPILAVVAGCALSVLLTGRELNAQPFDAPSPIQLGGSASVVFYGSRIADPEPVSDGSSVGRGGSIPPRDRAFGSP